MMTDKESTPSDHILQPGIYKILNNANPDSAIDLSGYDMKKVIGKWTPFEQYRIGSLIDFSLWSPQS
jgi:hypothetical protein